MSEYFCFYPVGFLCYHAYWCGLADGLSRQLTEPTQTG